MCASSAGPLDTTLHLGVNLRPAKVRLELIRSKIRTQARSACTARSGQPGGVMDSRLLSGNIKA